jgi:prephenate dehydratase
MAKPRLMTYFKTSLEDRPGTLLGAAREMKSKNLGLLALWGYGTRTGQGELYCIPKNPDKFRTGYKPAGMQTEEGRGVFLKGTDTTGALVKTLETIANEGVNIVAIHAIAVSGNFGSFIYVAQADVDKTAAALGAK